MIPGTVLEQNGRRKHWLEISAVSVLLLLAAFLRLAAVDFGLRLEQLDNDALYYYYTPARNLVEGRGFFQNDYDINAPLQALFFAANMLIPGRLDVVWMQLFQVAISLIGLVAAWAWTRNMAGAGVAFVFTFFLSINSELVSRTPVLLTESNYVSLFFVAMALFQRFINAPGYAGAVASGFALSVCCLQRFNPLLLPVLLGMLVCFGADVCWRRSILYAGIFMLSFAVPITTWALRNKAAYGHAVPTISQSGSILYFGNHPGLDNARTLFFEDYFYQFEWMDESIEAVTRNAQYAAPFAARIAYDKLYQSKFIQYASSSPLHFLRNYFIRFGKQFTSPAPNSSAGTVTTPFSGVSGVISWLSVALIMPGVILYTWKNSDRKTAFTMLVCFAYFAYFGALFHLTNDGRMNLLLRSLTLFWTAYLVVELLKFFQLKISSRFHSDVSIA